MKILSTVTNHKNPPSLPPSFVIEDAFGSGACSPSWHRNACLQGGGGFHGGNISLWEISYIKCVRTFPLNFQAAVRNKLGAKFSHWGFTGFAGGMLCVSHCSLPPPPSSVGFWPTRCSPPLFPVSCPILHLALLSEVIKASKAIGCLLVYGFAQEPAQKGGTQVVPFGSSLFSSVQPFFSNLK